MRKSYANLDILRSLAVMSVVAQHLWHQCVNFNLCNYDPIINQRLHNLSFTGVMFFFVHTCLVLMGSMQRAPEVCWTSRFLIRRAFRIYPLCWATIVLVLVTGLSDQPGGNIHDLGWKGIAANLFLVQNILRRFPSVVGPLWSLPWEVQMYVVLPAFWILLKRFRGVYVVLTVWLGATALAVVATQPLFPRMWHATIFPPMFIAGIVAYRILEERGGKSRSCPFSAYAWPGFILALFVLQVLLMGERSTESPLGAVLDSGICLLLAFSIPAFEQAHARWLVEPARLIARYSYGIYLLHLPALILVMRYLSFLPFVLKISAFVLLTGFLAFSSFHLIEDPLIKLSKRVTHTGSGRAGVGAHSPLLLIRAANSIPANSSESSSSMRIKAVLRARDATETLTEGEAG